MFGERKQWCTTKRFKQKQLITNNTNWFWYMCINSYLKEYNGSAHFFKTLKTLLNDCTHSLFIYALCTLKMHILNIVRAIDIKMQLNKHDIASYNENAKLFGN